MHGIKPIVMLKNSKWKFATTQTNIAMMLFSRKNIDNYLIFHMIFY